LRFSSGANFSASMAQRSMVDPRFPLSLSLESRHHKRGATDVNLALRLDVLTVCVVFAFVAAILLGAF
jgi:hypothetical protein